MFPDQDPLDTHVANVRAIGITPPPQWIELLARFQAYSTLDSPMAQRLASAVIGDADDVATLRALALAEASAMPPVRAEVDHVVRSTVLAKLREYYRAYAAPNYQQVGADFDGLAKQFTAAANAVDPETPAEQLIHASDKIRKAFSDAEKYAHQLTDSMARLRAAASLAGVPAAERGEILIALCVDTTGLHRRRVWEAWRIDGGRTTRWGALLGIGATIRAHDLHGFEPYRTPRPMEIKQVPHGIGIRQVSVDPEDAEVQAVAVT